MLRSLTLLLAVVCCTGKPDATPPLNPAGQGLTLSFNGLGGALKHNEPFSVSVTVNGDISAAASGDATQALTITLSQRIGTGDWQKEGEEVAADNSATFNLTLSAGDYTLKAETKGAATLSQESSPFTVSTGEVSGIKLSFSEDSYMIKTGALFDVTVNVTESDKLDDYSRIALKLLKDDGSKVDMLMQWQGTKEAMQPPGAAISVEVDKGEGKAVFENLFIVDAKDVAKLQAVLEYESSSLAVEAEFSSTGGDMKFEEVRLSDQSNNNIEIVTDPAVTNQTSTSIYFFNNSADPVTVHGAHAGSGKSQHVDADKIADLDKHCYDLAVMFFEDNYAFLQHNVVNGNSDCNK